MGMLDALRRLPVKSPGQLLHELHDLHTRFRGGDPIELPQVTVMLTSGQSLRGEVIQLDQAGVETVLLLRVVDPGYDVLYLPQSFVAGVMVHYTEANLHLLSSGTIRPLDEAVPSRLALNRQAQAIGEALRVRRLNCPVQLNWDLLPMTNASLQVIGQFLQDLQSILVAIQADDIGSIALETQVQQIVIQADAEISVLLQAQTLTLSIARAGIELAPWPIDSLRQAIEQRL